MKLPSGWVGRATDDRGVIGTIDLVTGERKVLSGKYEDPAEGNVEVGQGPTLDDVFAVTRAASGTLLATVHPKAVDGVGHARSLAGARHGAHCHRGR